MRDCDVAMTRRLVLGRAASGLEPGRYELTLAGKDPVSIDVPRGKTRIKVWATGKKHNCVGHVTLLR